ncbi:hypothetical protein Tsubulata_023206 [Turnera subulata]|uniref:Uncharacterized protein n=1 Tax=Turnera subulata TaxID=218843 RepID=A0A9Q0F6I7_9ROSI|nr:hypothetical protein Tsubulata_023206 [Turnera subulata]
MEGNIQGGLDDDAPHDGAIDGAHSDATDVGANDIHSGGTQGGNVSAAANANVNASGGAGVNDFLNDPNDATDVGANDVLSGGLQGGNGSRSAAANRNVNASGGAGVNNFNDPIGQCGNQYAYGSAWNYDNATAFGGHKAVYGSAGVEGGYFPAGPSGANANVNASVGPGVNYLLNDPNANANVNASVGPGVNYLLNDPNANANVNASGGAGMNYLLNHPNGGHQAVYGSAGVEGGYFPVGPSGANANVNASVGPGVNYLLNDPNANANVNASVGPGVNYLLNDPNANANVNASGGAGMNYLLNHPNANANVNASVGPGVNYLLNDPNANANVNASVGPGVNYLLNDPNGLHGHPVYYGGGGGYPAWNYGMGNANVGQSNTFAMLTQLVTHLVLLLAPQAAPVVQQASAGSRCSGLVLKFHISQIKILLGHQMDTQTAINQIQQSLKEVLEREGNNSLANMKLEDEARALRAGLKHVYEEQKVTQNAVKTIQKDLQVVLKNQGSTSLLFQKAVTVLQEKEEDAGKALQLTKDGYTYLQVQDGEYQEQQYHFFGKWDSVHVVSTFAKHNCKCSVL